jgi:DNA repair exonuclease SbcCD ATPase subunit
MNRIDSLERTLSSATETALAAKYRAANLEDLVQSLIGDNQELRDELKSIKGLVVDNQKLHDELKSAQSDNQELREELKSISTRLIVDNQKLHDELKSISTRLDLVIKSSDSRTGMAKDEITRLMTDVESLDSRDTALMQNQAADLNDKIDLIKYRCRQWLESFR